MALCEAYFDESGTQENGIATSVLCLGGLIVESEKAKQMDAQWTAMLNDYGLPYFHMVDCAHGVGVFKTLDKQARIAVEKRAIQIIRQHAEKCFAVTVDPFVFEHEAPDHPTVGSAYSLLAHSCFTEVAIWGSRVGFEGTVAYFFEAGHRSQSEANRIMNLIASFPALKQRHFYGSHTFADKAAIPILQAADIVAWLWHSDCNRRFFRSHRPLRADLKALFAPRWENDKFMAVAHLGSEEIRRATYSAMMSLYPNTYPWREMMKQSNEYATFNAAMDTILKADPAKVKAEMEEDKQRREDARKAKKEASK